MHALHYFLVSLQLIKCIVIIAGWLPAFLITIMTLENVMNCPSHRTEYVERLYLGRAVLFKYKVHLIVQYYYSVPVVLKGGFTIYIKAGSKCIAPQQ